MCGVWQACLRQGVLCPRVLGKTAHRRRTPFQALAFCPSYRTRCDRGAVACYPTGPEPRVEPTSKTCARRTAQRLSQAIACDCRVQGSLRVGAYFARACQQSKARIMLEGRRPERRPCSLAGTCSGYRRRSHSDNPDRSATPGRLRHSSLVLLRSILCEGLLRSRAAAGREEPPSCDRRPESQFIISPPTAGVPRRSAVRP
jgi:hypothetical protein